MATPTFPTPTELLATIAKNKAEKAEQERIAEIERRAAIQIVIDAFMVKIQDAMTKAIGFPIYAFFTGKGVYTMGMGNVDDDTFVINHAIAVLKKQGYSAEPASLGTGVCITGVKGSMNPL